MLLPTVHTKNQENDDQLQLAKTLWLEGDWATLTDLATKKGNSEKSVELDAYLSAAFAQQGNREKAISHWHSSKSSETEEYLYCYRLLISGVHNSLARARAVNGDLQKSQKHWGQSLGLVVSGPQRHLVTKMRAKYQLKQLNLPESWADKESKALSSKPYLLYEILSELHECYPSDPAVLIGLAESAQRQMLYDESIRHWQTLASMLQEEMPQAYYDRLDEAYQKQQSFPLGTPEEEQLRGEGDKHELLQYIHKILKPSLYLEIGVQTGKSFLLADCEAVGIDPMPRPNISLKKNHTLLRMTSDEFFSHHAELYLHKSPDLVFIDGMHLFEYALRDFINTERFSSANTVVIVDDVFPGHPAQAEKKRRTRAWTGDVWKLVAVLKKYRPDLEVEVFDIYPTGLLMVRGLNYESDLLSYNYEKIIDEMNNETIPKRLYIDREGAQGYSDFLRLISSV